MSKWSRYNVEVDLGRNDGQDVAVFNCLTRNLVRLDHRVLESVKASLADGGASDALDNLRKVGIVVDDSLDEIAYMRHTLGRWKFAANPSVIFISFASACNLRCVYCYQDRRSRQPMSFLCS